MTLIKVIPKDVKKMKRKRILLKILFYGVIFFTFLSSFLWSHENFQNNLTIWQCILAYIIFPFMSSSLSALLCLSSYYLYDYYKKLGDYIKEWWKKVLILVSTGISSAIILIVLGTSLYWVGSCIKNHPPVQDDDEIYEEDEELLEIESHARYDG